MIRAIKNAMKRVGPVYAVNAALKARRTKARYRRLCAHYESVARERGIVHEKDEVAAQVRRRLAERGFTTRPTAEGALGILFVGADEAQDCSGFLQTLERLGRVCRFTQADGSYGHFHGDRAANGRRLLQLIEQATKEGPVHVVLGQMWGRTMPWQALDQARRRGCVTVNICLDDRHTFRGRRRNGEWMGTAGLIPGLDLVLTAAPETCLWYAVEGLPALFWPEASDPAFFHPVDSPKQHDVCFVGSNYGVRKKVVCAIEKRGIRVECYGNGWPNGRIAAEQTPALFAASRIVLGVGTIGHCSDIYSLKIRDFDATLSGSFYLTHANPDLTRLFDVGREIVCYTTPEECADKCVYYLAHNEEREAIARAGRARSLRGHTWDVRFRTMFEVLGLLPSQSVVKEGVSTSCAG